MVKPQDKLVKKSALFRYASALSIVLTTKITSAVLDAHEIDVRGKVSVIEGISLLMIVSFSTTMILPYGFLRDSKVSDYTFYSHGLMLQC